MDAYNVFFISSHENSLVDDEINMGKERKKQVVIHLTVIALFVAVSTFCQSYCFIVLSALYMVELRLFR